MNRNVMLDTVNSTGWSNWYGQRYGHDELYSRHITDCIRAIREEREDSEAYKDAWTELHDLIAEYYSDCPAADKPWYLHYVGEPGNRITGPHTADAAAELLIDYCRQHRYPIDYDYVLAYVCVQRDDDCACRSSSDVREWFEANAIYQEGRDQALGKPYHPCALSDLAAAHKRIAELEADNAALSAKLACRDNQIAEYQRMIGEAR